MDRQCRDATSAVRHDSVCVFAFGIAGVRGLYPRSANAAIRFERCPMVRIVGTLLGCVDGIGWAWVGNGCVHR